MPAVLRLPVVILVVGLVLASRFAPLGRESADWEVGRIEPPADPLPPGSVARLGTHRLRSPADTDRVALSRNARLIVTTRTHSLLEVWDGRTGSLVRTIPTVQYPGRPRYRGDGPSLLSEEVAAMAFTADTDRFHVLTQNGLLRSCDVLTGAWSEPLARTNTPPPKDSGWRWTYGFASPDGTHFAYLPDADRNPGETRRIEVFALGHDKPILEIAGAKHTDWHQFSADNKFATLTRDGATLRVTWDTAVGSPVTEFAMPGEAFIPLGLVRSPDGRAVAVAYAPRFRGRDDSIDWRDHWPLFVYDADTGRERYRVSDWKGHLAGYSPDGTKLVGVDRNEAVIADAATGRVTNRLKGHDLTHIRGTAFSPDRRYFATCGGRDRSVIVWNVQTGKPALDFDAPRGPIHTIVFSPDGKSVFTSTSQEGTGWLWDAETGERKRRFVVAGKEAPHTAAYTTDAKGHPQTAAFTPDGKYVVAGYGYGVISGGNKGFVARLWRVSDGALVREFGDHTDGVLQVAMSPDGKRIATRGGADGNAFLWETDTGNLAFTAKWVPYNEYGPLTFSPRGELIGVSSDHEGGIKSVDLASGITLAPWKMERPARAVAVSPDGRLVVSREEDPGRGERIIVVRRVATGEKLCALPLDDVSHTSPITFSHDGRLVAVSGVGHRYYEPDTVYLFDTASGKQLRTIRGHRGQICALAFSPDGTRLATGSWDTTVLIWDLTARP